MLWTPKSSAIIQAPAEALDEYGNPRIGGGCPSSHRMLMAAAGVSGAGFPVGAVRLDGSTEWSSWVGDGGLASSQGMWGSFWFKITGGDGTVRTILSNTTGAGLIGIQIGAITANKFHIYNSRTDATKVFIINAATAIVAADGNWHHAAFSCKLSATASAEYLLDGVDDIDNSTATEGETFDNVEGSTWGLGARGGGAQPTQIDFAEFIFTTDHYMDVSANIAKLISGGKPVDPGSDGSTPSGTQPEFYFSIREGEDQDDWKTNRGTEANWTENGTFADAPDSPSD